MSPHFHFSLCTQGQHVSWVKVTAWSVHTMSPDHVGRVRIGQEGGPCEHHLGAFLRYCWLRHRDNRKTRVSAHGAGAHTEPELKEGRARRCLPVPVWGCPRLIAGAGRGALSHMQPPDHSRWATKDGDKPQGRSHSPRDARLICTLEILSVLPRQDWPSGNAAASVPPEISPTLPTKGKKPTSLQHDQGCLLPSWVSSSSGTNRPPGFPASCSQEKEVWINVYGQQPGGSVVKKSTCQCQRLRFDPWVRKCPWRRKWQPTGIPWIEEPSRLQSMGSQKVGCNLETEHYKHPKFRNESKGKEDTLLIFKPGITSFLIPCNSAFKTKIK